MTCYKCDFYKSGYMYNACALTEFEYFRPLDDCTLVNDDGTINYNDPYFVGLKQEATDGQKGDTE